MIGISIANSIGFTGASVLPDASAQAYFAATGIANVTQQQAINNLVKGLKSDGLWSKMKAVYPFVTDNRNLLGYTEDFSNVLWEKGPNVTISANSVLAPNGTLTADSINVTGTSAKYIFQTISYTGSHTLSFYAKYQSLQFIQLLISTDGTKFANFDILNGSVTRQDNATGSIENVGNGLFRCSMSFTSTSQTQVLLGVVSSGTSTRVQSNSLVGTSYIWGAQLELGSTATTYQPIATTQQAFIANQFKYNLVNPLDSDAAFRLVFNGGWTHSSTGALPNGTNGYADTKLVPSTNGFTTANGHISFYSRNTNVNGQFPVDLGVDQTGTGLNVSQKMSDAGSLSYHGRAYAQLLTGVDLNNIVGLHTVTRVSTTSLKYNRNGSVIQTNSVLEAGTIPTVALFLGCTNNNGTAGLYSTRQAAFASIGDGLTDTEAANLYTRVQAYQTALSRQV